MDMKELYEILAKDVLKEWLTRRELVVFAIAAPLALAALCALAELLNN